MRQRSGFTLMELIAALGVMGILAVLIVGIGAGMAAVTRETQDAVEVNHMARVALERITRDLSHAYLSLNQGLEERTKTVFIGDRDRLLFCYLGNIPVMAGGLETDQGVVEYRIGGASDDREGRKLIRRFKALIDDDPEDGGDEFVIAEGITRLAFEYYDRDQEDWESEWQADDPLAAVEPGFVLPWRVKVHLEMVDARGVEYVFETQTSIYVRKPLLFGKPSNPKVLEAKTKNDLEKQIDRAKKGIPPSLQGGGGLGR